MTAERKKRVLVMDDSFIVLETVRLALTDIGFDVDVVSDMDELAQCEKTQYDLVLLDFQMPNVFGEELLNRLRRGQSENTKIFILSAVSDEVLRSRVASHHFDGYISKALGVDVVAERVQELLGPAAL